MALDVKPQAAAISATNGVKRAATDTFLEDHHEPNGSNESDEIRVAPQAGQRRKRKKYVLMACSECKRRKIKCNGNTPCQRCSNLSLSCFYQPRTTSQDEAGSPTSTSHYEQEFRHITAQLATLTQAVNQLVSFSSSQRRNSDSRHSLTPVGSGNVSHHSPVMTNEQTNQSHRQQSAATAYKGPTSSQYSLNIAKKSLASWGIHHHDLGDEVERTPPVFTAMPPSAMTPKGVESPVTQRKDHDDLMRAPESSPAGMSASNSSVHKPPSPEALQLIEKEQLLLSVGVSSAKHLFHVYDEEINSMYPFLEMTEFLTFFKGIWEDDGLNLISYPMTDICLVKMVLAVSMAVEEQNTDTARGLYDEVLTVVERKILDGVADVDTLVLLILIHKYQFHVDLESQAYRTIGFATRMCFELGLHSAPEMAKMFPNISERSWTIRIFWVVYVLDRRLAFSTGRPFSFSDDDVDQDLPYLQEEDGHNVRDDGDQLKILYFRAMIDYSRLSARVWNLVSKIGSDSTPKEGPNSPLLAGRNADVENTDNQISEWQQSIPTELRFSPEIGFKESETRQWLRKLQVLLYLRANQMRVHTYRPFLLSTSAIQYNLEYATRAATVAKDTIRVINHLHRTTPLYSSCSIHYNYFLVSALAVLFIAIINDPANFCGTCREEFDMAVNLVKMIKGESVIGMRLWSTIKGLRKIVRKISGLTKNLPSAGSEPGPHDQAGVRDYFVPVSNVPQHQQQQQHHPGMRRRPSFLESQTKRPMPITIPKNAHPEYRAVHLKTEGFDGANAHYQHVSMPPPAAPSQAGTGLEMSTELNELFFLASAGYDPVSATSSSYSPAPTTASTTWSSVQQPMYETVGGNENNNTTNGNNGNFIPSTWNEYEVSRVLGQWI